MTAVTTSAPRALPKFGGFNLGMIRLELKRMMRNKRTLIFALIMPAVFFELFGGLNSGYRHETIAPGINVTGYILINMAVYGAMLSTTSGGAMVSIERAAGWSRQLRLTPLKPVAYIFVKLTLAMLIGALSVIVVNVVGIFGGAKLPLHAWIECALLAWVLAIVFAAFGLFMGYLLPSENVMQILGPGLAILSLAGGLFSQPGSFGHAFDVFSKYTPVYGVAEVARYPEAHSGNLGLALLNVAVWTAIFSGGAIWRFRRDTARV